LAYFLLNHRVGLYRKHTHILYIKYKYICFFKVFLVQHALSRFLIVLPLRFTMAVCGSCKRETDVGLHWQKHR